MHTRLSEIIKYKTGGKQTDFAAFMGWNPAYLSKLLFGGSFGIQPVVSILTKIPEIDARWLILGEGDMFVPRKLNEMRKAFYRSVAEVLETEKYLPVMTAEELARFAENVKFDASTIKKWEQLLSDKNR